MSRGKTNEGAWIEDILMKWMEICNKQNNAEDNPSLIKKAQSSHSQHITVIKEIIQTRYITKHNCPMYNITHVSLLFSPGSFVQLCKPSNILSNPETA